MRSICSPPLCHQQLLNNTHPPNSAHNLCSFSVSSTSRTHTTRDAHISCTHPKEAATATMKQDLPARPSRPSKTPAPAASVPRAVPRRVVPEGPTVQRKAACGVGGRNGAKEESKKAAAAGGGLRERLEASERLVGALRAEVTAMRELMERMGSLNQELELQNRQYEVELSACEAKIKTLERIAQEKLDEESAETESRSLAVHHVSTICASCSGLLSATTNLGKLQATNSGTPQEVVVNSAPPPPPAYSSMKECANGRPPPPPPPPPFRNFKPRAVTMQRAPSLVEFYHSLTKRGREKVPPGSPTCGGAIDSKAHTSIVGEIQNRSAHLIAIKADVETKGDFIVSLIENVQSAAFADIEDLSAFVDWLDNKLSTLADERAVLKHFNWPEKKADAMREAAIEYRALKRLENEIHMFEDDPCMPFELVLKKIATVLEKLEKNTQRLTMLRDVAMHTYKEAKIPTDWMLDSGTISKLKVASMKLAKVCMRRVSSELQSIRHCEKESIQESVLLQCVRVAYRVHQFAGGLDMEAMTVFEELRRRVCLDNRGSQELLPRIVVL